MVLTILDYVTAGTFCLLAVAILLVLFMLMRRNENDFFHASSKVFLPAFIAFLLALFANSLYLSIPNTCIFEMLPRRSSPRIFLTYPSIARTGETVEIVLEAMTNGFQPLKMDVILQNHETGEIIDRAFITISSGSSKRLSFRNRMSRNNFAVEVVVRHPDLVDETSLELRTTVIVRKCDIEVATLLIMGVVVAISVSLLTIEKRWIPKS